MSLIRYLIDSIFLFKVSGLSCCLMTSGSVFQATAALWRGEVHDREEGEMARKSREEGEIGAKM